MTGYTESELKDAERVIASLLSKCERAQEGLKPGSAQESLMKNRISGLRVMLDLIQDPLAHTG